MAGSSESLIETPAAEAGRNDALSDVLRNIRLSGSLQFCFMPSGAWKTDATPSLAKMAASASSTIPFHIVVEGSCWLKMEGVEAELDAGDVVAFPFGTGHQLGAGDDGRLVTPVADLPPKPWRSLPVLRYGEETRRVRLLCGYLNCDAVNFRPLRNALPLLLHVKTRDSDPAGWLKATIDQIVAEVDTPRAGGLSMMERLTEVTFIELLRHQMLSIGSDTRGWLAALADPALGRCLALIHADPHRAWTVPELAIGSGLSRTTLAARFEGVLATTPMRYLREWRLCLASVALATTQKPIAEIAYDSGYGAEAAFNRAFARFYGAPPAAWRQTAGRVQT